MRARRLRRCALIWLSVVCALLVCAAVAVAVHIRFNRLSMVVALAEEARRQLESDRRERRALVPVFRDAAAAALRGPQAEDLLAELDAALESSRAADAADRLGPAEARLTAAVERVGALLRDGGAPLVGASDVDAGHGDDAARSARRHSADVSSAVALHHELRTLEHQIASAVRHCNHSVRACARLRSGLLSLPLRGSFAAPPPVVYAPAEYDDDRGGLAAAVPCGDETSRTPGAEGYRPGPVGESL